jgi:plasmid replication initiation protein
MHDPKDGRDELNLAELPWACLDKRIPKEITSLVFEGQHGKLTVHGSAAFGLPRAAEMDILLSLLQLTRTANNFTNPTVGFSRYELLRLMGWADSTKNYRRLDRSLNVWMGVLLIFEKGWYDNSVKRRVDAKFHILENVVTYEGEDRKEMRAASVFTWNSIFFASLQANNLKRLDLSVYFSLQSAISKRIYRFLDKRFYKYTSIKFDLNTFAFEHIGMSRNYPMAQVRVKLAPAIAELEGIGFLRHRYERTGRGQWTITLEQGKVY